MKDNFSPIIEKKTIFETLKEMYGRVNKPVKKNKYFASPYLLEEDNDTYQYTDFIDTSRAFREAALKFGVTSDKCIDGLLHFNSILTPTEMKNMFSNCTTLKEIPEIKFK